MFFASWSARADHPAVSGGEVIGVGASRVVVGEGSTIRSRDPLIASRGIVCPELVASLARGVSARPVKTCAAVVATDGTSLFVGRGPLGGYALYYAWTAQHAAFLASSDLGILLQARGRTSLHVPKLATLSAGTLDADPSATEYEGVFRLRCGESLLVSSGGVDRILELPSPEFRDWVVGRPEELARELRRRVQRAVERTLDGVGRVGVLVGGLDSSALAAALVAASRGANRREISLLTVDVDDPSTDAPYVDDVAAAFGIVPIHIAEDDLALPAVVNGQLNRVGARELAICKEAKSLGVNVVLTGDGGDELFGGAPTTLGSALLLRHPVAALRTAACTQFPFAGRGATQAWDLALRPALRIAIPSVVRHARILRALRRSLPWATARMMEFLGASLCENDKLRAVNVTRPSELLAAYAGSQTYLDFADARAQIEAAAKIMRSDPFFDMELARFSTAIRPDLLHTGGIHRGLCRLAFADELPARVLSRVGKGEFARDTPGAVRGHPETNPQLPGLQGLGLVDGAAFRRAWERASDARAKARLAPFLAVDTFVRWHDADRV